MNDLTPSAPDAPVSPKPYEAPMLTDLGSIEAITAGPDGSKSLDMVVGGDGGFQRDTTS